MAVVKHVLGILGDLEGSLKPGLLAWASLKPGCFEGMEEAWSEVRKKEPGEWWANEKALEGEKFFESLLGLILILDS